MSNSSIMLIRNSIQAIADFISYWYMRYLLVTELYIVEPWERAVMHILMLLFLIILSYLNLLLARHIPSTTTFFSEILL